MEFLNNLFFDIQFNGDYQYWAIELLAFLGISALVLMMLYLLSVKINRPRFHLEYQLGIRLMWALSLFQVLMAVYVFFLFRLQGFDAFRWDQPGFYLAFAPQLIVFITIIFMFIITYKRVLRNLKAQI